MKLLFFVLLLLIFVPISSAIYSNEYREHLTDVIYNTCDKNLKWKNEPVFYPDGKIVVNTGDLITRDKIRAFVDYIETLNLNNDFKMIGSPVEQYPMRFFCNNHTLRVNDNRYYWDGVEVTAPINITNINEENFIKIGALNLTIFEFSISLISLSIFSLSIFLIVFIRIKKEFSLNIFNKQYILKIDEKNPKKPDKH